MLFLLLLIHEITAESCYDPLVGCTNPMYECLPPDLIWPPTDQTKFKYWQCQMPWYFSHPCQNDMHCYGYPGDPGGACHCFPPWSLSGSDNKCPIK